jgi:hypothetical protein
MLTLKKEGNFISIFFVIMISGLCSRFLTNQSQFSFGLQGGRWRSSANAVSVDRVGVHDPDPAAVGEREI